VAVREFSTDEVFTPCQVRELVERHAAELIRHPRPRSSNQSGFDHYGAAAKGELRTVFRLNLLFRRVLLGAFQNEPVLSVVEQFAMRTQAINPIQLATAHC
jgi:DNA-binding GntR family transcriptional regulator